MKTKHVVLGDPTRVTRTVLQLHAVHDVELRSADVDNEDLFRDGADERALRLPVVPARGTRTGIIQEALRSYRFGCSCLPFDYVSRDKGKKGWTNRNQFRN